MDRRYKLGKIAATVLITILIWVWADLAVNETFTVHNVDLRIAKSAGVNLWVYFQNNQSSVSLDTLVLEGAASAVAEAKRKLNQGFIHFEFFLVPQQHDLTKTGEYTVNVLEIIRDSDTLKQLGLTAKSCKPEQITVNVVELVKKAVAVQCFDEEQNPVKNAIVEPPQVDAFVPPSWSGEKLNAKVQLTQREIVMARISPIERKPFMELSPGQVRELAATVRISMPAEEELLRPETIKNATLGFSLSTLVQGKFQIEVTNLSEVLSPVAIRATPEARLAYENMRFHVILDIDDSDRDSQTEIRRELTYNFPPEFVRKNEIVLNQQPVTARFKLVPIASPASTQQ